MVVATNLMHVVGCEDEPTRSHPAAQSTGLANDLNVGVLFGRLLDAVVIARLGTGRIVLWNPAAEKLFGYSADEAIGRSIELLMPAPITQVHRAGLERYLRTGHGLIIDAGEPVEVPARHKSGDEFRVELALSTVTSSNGERFAVAVIRDATRRKQLELTNLELAQARVGRSEAEAALATQDELLDAVEATLESGPSPDELKRLGSTLAELGRLRRGEITVRPVSVDLVDVVHAASDAARRRASGQRLLVHTPPAAPASADPAQLRQVLDQVLDEALLRTGDGAKIEVRVDVPSMQVVQLSVRAAGGGGQSQSPGINLLASRMLMQRQGGTFSMDTSMNGSFEVSMTLRGIPHMRRRSSPARRPGRSASHP